MELKITKGEWYWKHDDITQSGVTIQSTNGETIVDFVMGKNIFEAEANARLIAAAPDMLAALKGILQEFPQQGIILNKQEERVITKAKNAIEKATS